MKTLIIPCCGMSLIDGIPNWLAKHPKGDYLLKDSISDLNIVKFDRIVISILKEDNDKYNAKSKLEKITSHIVPSPEIIEIQNRTNGPADTVYQTIKIANIIGSIVIKDSDVKLLLGHLQEDNFIAGIDLMESKGELPDIRSKAFLKINENNIILDVIEKQVSSNKICYGMYGFSNHSDFMEAYEALCDFNYEMNEIFVSNIIAYLIGKKDKIFHYIEAKYYEDLDNYESILRLRKRYSTYFVNIDEDRMQIFFPRLKNLEQKGSKIVFYSSKPKTEYENIKKMLNDNGFVENSIIAECNCGEFHIINSIDGVKI